ncbi:MAG TPA: hypothetical protein VFW11_15285 [Cyclobacteriaceae bacterium]|nr:hypothetical protein [Cyclobacteriaceae bacterium]
MRKYLSLMAAGLILASCSSPKYTYYFDRQDYNAGKKQNARESLALTEKQEESKIESPLKLDPQTLVASADNSAAVLNESKAEVASKSYKEMTKTEKKEFRKEAKTLIKSYVKAKKAGDEVKAAEAAAAMDHDLKLAAIFGAVGIVALIIGGDVFWIIGGIALIIGVVFFVLWLSRQ